MDVDAEVSGLPFTVVEIEQSIAVVVANHSDRSILDQRVIQSLVLSDHVAVLVLTLCEDGRALFVRRIVEPECSRVGRCRPDVIVPAPVLLGIEDVDLVIETVRDNTVIPEPYDVESMGFGVERVALEDDETIVALGGSWSAW